MVDKIFNETNGSLHGICNRRADKPNFDSCNSIQLQFRLTQRYWTFVIIFGRNQKSTSV
jgi:hypothetical protein